MPASETAADFPDTGRLAVLVSGGLDSAILVGEARSHVEVVHPIFVRGGLGWETAELAHLREFLTAIAGPKLGPLVILDAPVADLVADHWSVTGRGVPDGRSPDDAVYLPGRNLFLLTKAMLWCHLHGIPALALGVLGANPFPDATPGFVTACANVINEAVSGRVGVYRPYASLRKAEVIRRGRGLPLAKTCSCLQPSGDLHCGHCNKCAERRRGFAEADMPDPTLYAADA